MNQKLKKMQKISGIKQGQYDNEKNRLYSMGQTILLTLKAYIHSVEEAGLTNEQFFLNFLDEINYESVKY